MAPKRSAAELATADETPAPPPPTTTTRSAFDALAEGGTKAAKRVRIANDAAGQWETHDDTLLVRTFGNPAPSAKIAMFDFDDTLVATKSGKTFATGAVDWKPWAPGVKTELQRLAGDGYKLVIYSNQKAISTERGKGNARGGGSKERGILGRFENFVEETGLDCQVLIATDDDQFRKPSTSGFEYFVEHMNAGVEPDKAASFFCGDAGGRPANWKPGAKRDFSCSDREFALNLGLPYKTPENVFLHDTTVARFTHDFDPRTVPTNLPLFTPTSTPLVSKDKELVIMVGFPGSGKSSFTKKYLVPEGYVRVNQDELKTNDKCVRAVVAAMEENKRVVVDNTCPSVEARQVFITKAKQYGYPVRIFKMNVSRELATHLNYVRMRLTGQRRVPDIAYNMFVNKFKEPSLSEGVKEIKQINFVPDFKDDKERSEFLKFT